MQDRENMIASPGSQVKSETWEGGLKEEISKTCSKEKQVEKGNEICRKRNEKEIEESQKNEQLAKNNNSLIPVHI